MYEYINKLKNIKSLKNYNNYYNKLYRFDLGIRRFKK